MKTLVLEICSGMGILIGIYLFLNNSTATASIISSLGTSTTKTVKTLQGRG